MKKFLIVIFAIIVFMVGMFAIMYNSYIKAYEEAHNHSSYSWTKVTYSVPKSSTSSSITGDDYKKSNTKYEQNSSSSLFNEYRPDDWITFEKEAMSLFKGSNYSKHSYKERLMRRYKLSEDDAQYVVDKLDIDWKEQALLKAKGYLRSPFSKEKLVWQLINMEKFTQEEANYAVENVGSDWKEEAVKMAEAYSKVAKLTKERVFELLIKVAKFTQEEAEYAIEHAKIDWTN